MFVFSVPGECLRDIKKLSTDSLITATAWESFMNEKSKEWTDLTLPVMQVDLTRCSLALRDYSLGGRDAHSQLELAHHPRSGHSQYRREEFDKSEANYFDLTCAEYQFPLDTGQYGGHCTWPSPGSLQTEGSERIIS